MEKTDPALLLETLANHEKALSRLYKEFSERFHRTRDLWIDLSKDEEMHGQWIQKMKSLYQQGKLEVNPDRITMMSVETSIQFIEGQIKKVESGKITESAALATASHIESAMIDEKYFRMFSFTDARLDKINEKLEKATAMHKKRLEKASQ